MTFAFKIQIRSRATCRNPASDGDLRGIGASADHVSLRDREGRIGARTVSRALRPRTLRFSDFVSQIFPFLRSNVFCLSRKRNKKVCFSNFALYEKQIHLTLMGEKQKVRRRRLILKEADGFTLCYAGKLRELVQRGFATGTNAFDLKQVGFDEKLYHAVQAGGFHLRHQGK